MFSAKMSDIAEVVMGQSPKTEDVNREGLGFPLLNGPTEFTSRYPVPVQYTTEGKRFSKAGDILFCVRGSTTGRMNYANQKYAIGRGIAAIRGKDGYPTPYIRAVIESSLNRLLASATGSTFPNVGRELLSDFEVEVVPVEKALAINELIVSLESKIELSRQTNQTLEQIAQAIFKSWFVDFEPTRAKIIAKAQGADPATQELAAQAIICGAISLEQLQGYVEESVQKSAQQREQESLSTRLQKAINEKLSQASANPLNAITAEQLIATAALFPNALVESELGEVPEGWVCGLLSDLCNLNPESWSKKTLPNIVNYVDLANAKNGEVSEVQVVVGQDIPSRARRVLKTGDTIIGTVRPGNRSFALVGEQNLTASTGFAVLRSKALCWQEFVYIAATSDSNIERLAHLADGGAYPAVRPDVVVQENMVLPSVDIAELYHRAVQPIFSKIIKNREVAKYLTQIRDTLLPKLLSGEIDVSALADNTEANA